MDDKRIADYFVISGLSPDGCRIPFEEVVSQDLGCNAKSQTQLAPITDIAVIITSQGEEVPQGYTCIETTPSGLPADLNHGSLRSPSVYLCYRRGRDKAPLVDIGVLYEGKERVMADSELVHTTPFGRPANVNNSGSRTFLTYRRARDNAPCNSLVVTDMCIILANKNESPPHAFCVINKNLNKGMVGSDVFVCYKKSMNRPPLLCFKPSILGRFPLEDYPHFSLPESVPLFCFPMGATVESWSKACQQPRPVFSTFVLTSEMAEKVYGAAITFYEQFNDEGSLSDEEKLKLQYVSEEDREKKSLHTIKSISILSRWPFFDTFERYLLFLHHTSITTSITPSQIPIERFISHFMLDVPFPSPQRPKILVQLGVNTEETVLISQPLEYMPLPPNGASFTQLLRNLGVENCLHVLLFALTEQKILFHSLRPDVLTSVTEAVITMIFPFCWQCPYIPMCPLGFCDVLNAPLPFIVGVDSRYFDHFEPPYDVACIDLDTNSIYLSEHKRILNPKLLPKKPTRVLKATLEKLFDKLMRPTSSVYGGQVRTSKTHFSTENLRTKKLERQIELEIQEAFIRFMDSILKNFRMYLLPITKAPAVGATDPSSLFDLQGFVKSRDKAYHKFYIYLMRTQMFTRFIEERSFVTSNDISLAFFDECSEKLESISDSHTQNGLMLFEIDESVQSDRTVYIPPPEPLSSGQEFTYTQFGPLNSSFFHRHPPITISRTGSLLNQGDSCDVVNAGNNISMSRRTKQEIRTAQRVARKHAESPLMWSKCLLSYCYSLWFIHLPSYVKINSSIKGKPLNIAYEVLLRMQTLKFYPADEVCYRVLMLLCGFNSQPALAVKVLFEMKQNGVMPNAITYGYYNRAVLESEWPTGDSTGKLMWNKLRNVIVGVSYFRKSGQTRAARIKQMSSVAAGTSTGVNLLNPTEGKPNSDGGYATNTESAGSGNSISSNDLTVQSNQVNNNNNNNSKIIKYDGVDFRASDKFRERTQNIVRKSAPSLSYMQDFDSPAGVLMTSNLAKYSNKDFTDEMQEFLRKRHKSEDQSAMATRLSDYESKTIHFSQSSSPKPYMRSQSFGNDAKIIQKMRQEALKDLKEEDIDKIENGKELDKKIDNLINKKKMVKLDCCTEDPEEEVMEEVFIEEPVKFEVMIENGVRRDENCDKKRLNESTSKMTSTPIDKKKSQHRAKHTPIENEITNATSNEQANGGKDSPSKSKSTPGSSNEFISSFSPLKDAIMNSEVFSPDGKVASTLRSSFRFASRFAKSVTNKSNNIARSSTFHSQAQVGSDKASLFGRDSGKKNDSDNAGTQMKTISRSATLPPTSASKNLQLKTQNENESEDRSESTESSESDEESDELSPSDLDPNEFIKGETFNSPWASKFASNKLYLHSTIKSAASNMANRFSGLKSSLASSSSVNSSPSKTVNGNANPNTSIASAASVATVASNTASLLSQWATMFAEKFPANFVFDDDDCSSTNSFDMRRSSFALSEDDVSERSKDDSLGRNFTGIGVSSSSSPLFDLLEKQYNTALDAALIGTNNKIVMEISITSCSRCHTCLALLYDEEIMDGWSADESNLNTQCIYCTAKFVPFLTVSINDMRHDDDSHATKPRTTSNCSFGAESSSSKDMNESKSRSTKMNERRGSKHWADTSLSPLTVPYLSPLVLRKEVENVLEHEGDLCLSKPEFVDIHPIIFWNLIWFFKRAHLPTHLHGLVLFASSINKNNKILDETHDYRNVLVRSMWDNEKLHEDIGKPMYQCWIEDAASRSSLLHALVTDDNKISRNLMRQIIQSIQCSDLSTPMKLIVERHKASLSRNSNTLATLPTKQHSIYRDLLFLSFVSLGRENIDHTAFDREYRRGYELLSSSENPGLCQLDKPPSVGAIFCRRFFKQLELLPVISTQTSTSMPMPSQSTSHPRQ